LRYVPAPLHIVSAGRKRRLWTDLANICIGQGHVETSTLSSIPKASTFSALRQNQRAHSARKKGASAEFGRWP
jgi:hypothetical protein